MWNLGLFLMVDFFRISGAGFSGFLKSLILQPHDIFNVLHKKNNKFHFRISFALS